MAATDAPRWRIRPRRHGGEAPRLGPTARARGTGRRRAPLVVERPPAPAALRSAGSAARSRGRGAGRPALGGPATAAKGAGGHSGPAMTGLRGGGDRPRPPYPSSVRCLPGEAIPQAGSRLSVAMPESSGWPEVRAARSAGTAAGGAGAERLPSGQAVVGTVPFRSPLEGQAALADCRLTARRAVVGLPPPGWPHREISAWLPRSRLRSEAAAPTARDGLSS